MSNPYLALAALAMLGGAAQAQAPAKSAATQQAPTRANLLKGLDATFKAVDTNGDGTLSAAEVQVAEDKIQQQRVAAIRSRMDAEFAKLDTNKDGQLSKAEFLAATPTLPDAGPSGAAVVTRLDKNKDGKISVDEFRAPRLSLFDAIDRNKDGVISDAERKAAAARR